MLFLLLCFIFDALLILATSCSNISSTSQILLYDTCIFITYSH